jgi:hypothetical protein
MYNYIGNTLLSKLYTRYCSVGMAKNISNMTKDLVTHHNRRKIDSFEHTPTYLVVTFQRGGIIRQIWNDSKWVSKVLYRDGLELMT